MRFTSHSLDFLDVGICPVEDGCLTDGWQCKSLALQVLRDGLTFELKPVNKMCRYVSVLRRSCASRWQIKVSYHKTTSYKTHERKKYLSVSAETAYSLALKLEPTKIQLVFVGVLERCPIK